MPCTGSAGREAMVHAAVTQIPLAWYATATGQTLSQAIQRLALTYAETEVGDLFVIAGSSGYLEIAANQTSAAGLLGCAAGAPVELDLG